MSHSSSAEARVEAWIRDYGRMVRSYVLALVRRDDVADDVVQEVFRRAWEARHRYQDQGAPRAYLLKIADRLVCDLGRRGRREVTLDDDAWRGQEPVDLEGEPSEAVCQDEARAALHAALEALTPLQRRVLLLRYYGDMSFAEIAEALESPLGTVLSHCRRGLLAIRKIMTGDTK